MEIYHNQEWARDARYTSFWAHYSAVEKWRTDHARMAEVACRVARNKKKPNQRRKTAPHYVNTPTARRPKRVSVNIEAEMEVVPEQNMVHRQTSVSVEVEEMSEEMVAFFRKTIEHRKSRAAEKAEKQRLEAEQRGTEEEHWIRLNDDDYVLADKSGFFL
ncbi:hypothetical protein ANCDUO_14960 [Ancylostoma duodenale]|uniref:Uncharacterized protein n=1 Tax=Ancylostoma duodenale TaxID=51022 RepID=A0A0C2CYK3_9BILA|nr:hypothetical protein ANCDUO_14960 [Ancylostoma duodenale]